VKSNYNYDINTMSLKLLLIDDSGDVIAKSVRPVVIPYQSQLNLLMETIIKIILYLPYNLFLLNYDNKYNEYYDVNIHLIDDYKEFIYDLPVTSTVELVITPPFLHIPQVYLSIIPKLTGLT